MDKNEFTEQAAAKQSAALLINESLAEAENGAQPIDDAIFFSDIKQKYGKL